MPPGPAARPEALARNEAILRAKVLQELDKGSAYLEQRVQRMFGGVSGLLLNPLAGMAFRTVGRDEVVRRAHRQLDTLVAAARAHGETPEAIFDGHWDRYRAHDEAWARANKAHGRFQELEGLLREVYVARVEAVSSLLHQGEGATYRDLVRSAFPSRDTAERILEREFVYADRVLVLAEQEHSLLHAPPLVRRELLMVLRDTYAWYKANVHRSLDEVYRAS